jgi:hypothetical protein
MKDRCKKPNQLKKPPLKRTSSHVYASSHKRLQQKLAELLGEVEEAERELARHTERQRCLLDLVLHQELVIELLHGDFMSVVAVQAGQDISLSRAWAAADVATAPARNVLQGSSNIEQCIAGATMQPLQGSGMLSSTAQPMLTNSAASSPLQQQQLRQQQQQQQQLQQLAADAHMPEAACAMVINSTAATAVGSSSSSSSELIARSYTAELLRTATPEDLYSAANMTTQGWHEQFYALFLRLVVLLELVNRNSAEAAQDAAGVTAMGNAAAAAGALVPDTAAAAAAAGVSAAEPAAAAAASPEFLRQLVSSGPHGTLAQMQATVDLHVRRVVIAYMFNHVPLLEACTADYATRQPSIPPPGHWQVSRS